MGRASIAGDLVRVTDEFHGIGAHGKHGITLHNQSTIIQADAATIHGGHNPDTAAPDICHGNSDFNWTHFTSLPARRGREKCAKPSRFPVCKYNYLTLFRLSQVSIRCARPPYLRWTASGPRTILYGVDHTDHVNLIRRGVEGTGTEWADLGAGSGAFTLALAEILGPGANIIAIDRERSALNRNAEEVRRRFPGTPVEYRVADFTERLDLDQLAGIVMANSLHFQRDQSAVVERVRGYLRPGGRLVIVEYNIDRGNYAVPYPVSFRRWQQLANDAGFGRTELLVRRPSRWHNEMYSAVSS